MAAETESLAHSGRRGSGGRRTSGPDRLTVWLVAGAAFLAVLALLAGQLRARTSRTAAAPVVVVRRIYETRIVETVPSAGGAAAGTSVSQSVSSSGAPAASAPVSTRTS
jgi:hypothetical protein